jgi:hypothetical protein
MGADEKLLPAPEVKEPEKPPEPAPTQAGAQTVEPPTLVEELNDEIPSKEGGSKSGREALPSSGVVVTKRGVTKFVKGRK